MYGNPSKAFVRLTRFIPDSVGYLEIPSAHHRGILYCAKTKNARNAHMDLDKIAVSNGSAQQSYGSSFDGFLASIQVGAVVAAIQIGGFVILRKRYRGKW
jgi:hypothetical protein